MTLRSPLSRHAPWHTVLSLLGVPIESMALPAMVPCPVCHGRRLSIYQDTKSSDTWHHCLDCNTHGDMIELAAAAWKVDVTAATARLADANAGLPAAAKEPIRISEYVRGYVNRRKRTAALLQQSQRPLLDGEYEFLRRELGLLNGNDAKLWLARMGPFAGGTTVLAVDEALRPWRQRNGRKAITSGRKPYFKGRGWKNVVIIPFHSMPRLCCGFILVGRKARMDQDVLFLPALPAPPIAGNKFPLEAGVCMYDAILATHEQRRFGRDVFVCNDPFQAMRWQCQHMRDHSVPLPLVGAYNHTIQLPERPPTRLVSYSIWDTQPSRRFVFWCEELNATTVNMAARANGQIAICPPPHGRKAPREWLRDVQRVATPWYESLDAFLVAATEGPAKSVLDQLDLPDYLWQTFRRNCSDEATSAILAREGSPDRQRVAVLGTRTVLDTASGWVYDGKLITDATLTISHVLYQAETDQAYYKGQINYRGHAYPFIEQQEVVEKATFSWMKKRLMASQAGIMFSTPSWSQHAVNIACLLHTPVILQGVGRFGWRYDHSAFVLPQFAIQPGGDITACVSQVLDDLAPAVDLLPDKIKELTLAPLLTESPAHKEFWASAAAIGANILAPAVNKRVAGVGLVGDGALVMGRSAARLWGCADRALTIGKQALIACEELETIATTHAWPLILTIPKGQKRQLLAPWLHSPSPKNVVLDVDRYFADALRTQSDWRFVTSETPVTAAPAVNAYGQQALFHWLRDVCSRRLRLDADPATPFGLQVLEDMAKWVERCGEDAGLLRESGALIDELSDSRDRANSFVALMYRCLDDGVLAFQREGFERATATPAIYYLEEGDQPRGIFIPRSTVNRVFAEHGVPVPDIVQLTATLAEAGGLECETRYQDMTGWLIRETWWDQQLELCRTQQTRILRIAT